MNNLVIDIGNSYTKLAVYQDRSQIHTASLESIDLLALKNVIAEYQVSNSIISSVKHVDDAVQELLQNNTQYYRFSHQTPLPIRNHYKSPETLGLDRLAALVGARAIYPAKYTLVIDAGTCITYDLITETDEYFGGSISPGIHMRLKALHEFTGKLPLVPFNANYDQFIGDDTNHAILSGVLNGVLAECKGIVESYQQRYPELNILLCGGDAIFFDTRLKNSIFAPNFSVKPDLVLMGLNEVIHIQHD